MLVSQPLCLLGIISQLNFQPEEGMNVLIRAEISVYESKRRNYQMYVEEMQPERRWELIHWPTNS